jgi:hypothetical protein
MTESLLYRVNLEQTKAIKTIEAQGIQIQDLEDRLDAAERALKQARQIADDAIATIRRGRA